MWNGAVISLAFTQQIISYLVCVDTGTNCFQVMEAEAQKAASEREHMRRASVYQKAEQRVQQLQRGLRSSINKSLVYFEEKTKVHAQLESQKERVQQLQRAIAASKTSYAQSLRSLEQVWCLEVFSFPIKTRG